MAEDVEIIGGKELEQSLTALPERLARDIIMPAMRAAANFLRKEIIASARAQFQAHTGRLFRGISTQVRRKGRGSKGTVIRYKIGLRTQPGNEHAFYGRFWERGFRHIGRGKGKRTQLRAGQLRERQITRGVKSGDFRFLKRSFMQPAFDAHAKTALEMIRSALATGLEEVARRVRIKARGIV